MKTFAEALADVARDLENDASKASAAGHPELAEAYGRQAERQWAMVDAELARVAAPVVRRPLTV